MWDETKDVCDNRTKPNEKATQQGDARLRTKTCEMEDEHAGSADRPARLQAVPLPVARQHAYHHGGPLMQNESNRERTTK